MVFLFLNKKSSIPLFIMKKELLICFFTTLVFLSHAQQNKNDVLSWVDPFIGTGGHGHTFPGATTPFGMIQLSPDQNTKSGDWDWCSGYHYSSKTIMGSLLIELS